MSLIELHDISFKYKGAEEEVFCGLDLKLEEGEALLAEGANGSGKTTLFRIINGLSFPQRGSYFFEGNMITEKYLRDNARAKRFHKQIGYLFQDPDRMLFCGSVYDEVAFGLRQMGFLDDEVDKRTLECLSLFSIEALRDKAPYHLSGGQKKRVALAACMALNPRVVVLDEPYAGLDNESVGFFADFFSELKRAGKTILIASHMTGDALRFIDRTLSL